MVTDSYKCMSCMGAAGGLRRPYPCNSTTAYGMATIFSQNDILIISII